jgi:hypothetical protein
MEKTGLIQKERKEEDLAQPTRLSSCPGWEDAVCAGFESERAVEQSGKHQPRNETLPDTLSFGFAALIARSELLLSGGTSG